MVHINDPKNCCGCTACVSVCNQNALTMRPDSLGFLYPEIDKSKCVECGLCVNICTFKDNYDISLNLTEPIVYGARHKDNNEVMQSRSGAVFVAISDYIIENGGVVYGAGYKDHFRVAHKRATTKETRDEFRGSKYVQSDLDDVFRDVKKDLNNGLTVLFSGTACQCAGLNSYIGSKFRQNLILVDIVCHGVPSPAIWDSFLDWSEKKHNSQVVAVDFRNKKKFGWSKHYETLTFQNGKKVDSYIYTYLFHKTLSIRKSCERCPFTNLRRPSDITLADFWGWKRTGSRLNRDNKGLSLVLCNTNKGLQLFNFIKSSLNYFETQVDQCMQPNLERPTSLVGNRNLFEEDFLNYDFDYVLEKYANEGLNTIPKKPENLFVRLIRKIINC